MQDARCDAAVEHRSQPGATVARHRDQIRIVPPCRGDDGVDHGAGGCFGAHWYLLSPEFSLEPDQVILCFFRGLLHRFRPQFVMVSIRIHQEGCRDDNLQEYDLGFVAPSCFFHVRQDTEWLAR